MSNQGCLFGHYGLHTYIVHVQLNSGQLCYWHFNTKLLKAGKSLVHNTRIQRVVLQGWVQCILG